MSLQLDARQRAMLAEMGIKVWLPTGDKKSIRPETKVFAKAAPITQPVVETIAKLPTVERRLPSGINVMNWTQLQQAVSTCNACGLCEGR
ncbi:MAG: uracil-DNA glycosylase, partial [Betaproteobacteria bacterium]